MSLEADMATHAIEPMDETGRWHARDVSYWSGRWDQVKSLLPSFELADFRAGSSLPPNPHMRAVIRKPRTSAEQPIPVGVVSNTYTLAPHDEVARQCFKGIELAGIDASPLRCELGLTELGEWMNLRIYFPKSHRHETVGGDAMDLRIECFNSVDGSSRLTILLGWLRLVCANGMVIGETMVELRDIHNQRLSLEPIPELIAKGLKKVEKEQARLRNWVATPINRHRVAPWANEDVTKKWGKKAACRVYHICTAGYDVDLDDPFAPGEATEKPVKRLDDVPGAKAPVSTLFDASQALSWVATRRNNPEERLDWQRSVPELIARLAQTA